MGVGGFFRRRRYCCDEKKSKKKEKRKEGRAAGNIYAFWSLKPKPKTTKKIQQRDVRHHFVRDEEREPAGGGGGDFCGEDDEKYIWVAVHFLSEYGGGRRYAAPCGDGDAGGG